MKMIRCFLLCVIVADFILVANGCQSIAALVDFALNQGIYKILNLYSDKSFTYKQCIAISNKAYISLYILEVFIGQPPKDGAALVFGDLGYRQGA